jgi:signal recognition particle subunit SEC65
VVHFGYNENMASPTQTSAARRRGRTLRQSVSIPAPLATEVRRVARERRLTISRALVTLAERGVQAEKDAKENLDRAYRTFLKERDVSKKDRAGKDLIRAIFGKDAIAEDSVL